MDNFISLTILGLIFCVIGFANIKGDISTIHWYNRRKITEDNRHQYGKCVGIGMIIIGVTIIISALLDIIFTEISLEALNLLGVIVGLGFVIYGQIKYNKGIF